MIFAAIGPIALLLVGGAGGGAKFAIGTYIMGLIITFMHRPELVIMDEPNAGLDPLVQHEFHELMRETAADGATVFLSSHTLSEVERVADRVGIIHHGKLIALGTVQELRSQAHETGALEKVFLSLIDQEDAHREKTSKLQDKEK